MLAFLEGVITFVSPCLLPMLPVYVSYFAGGSDDNAEKSLKNALGFVLGFTIVFVAMGALAGTIGGFFVKHRVAVNVITGAIVVFFGLSYIGVFKLSIFKGSSFAVKNRNMGFFSALLFGCVFSIGWTPCVGAFLSSALMLASREGSALSGIIMLLLYSLGLGIPFVISAVLIDKLKSVFGFIKKHYGVINIICGAMLVMVGILMITGVFDFVLGLLSRR